MAESVYKIIELVGTSTESWEKAASAAVARASGSLRDLRVAEVLELDMAIENGGVCTDEMIVETLQGWIDEDRKHTALKALQGLVWEAGYRNADFTAPLYPDASAQLRAWHSAGHPIAVYSSGSVPAQKLLFAHTDAGDLTSLFSGWFDTAMGHKREAESYRRIAQSIGKPANEIVFLSDVVEELDAAREAGMRTVLIDRREDYPVPRAGERLNGHKRVDSFADIPDDLLR